MPSAFFTFLELFSQNNSFTHYLKRDKISNILKKIPDRYSHINGEKWVLFDNIGDANNNRMIIFNLQESIRNMAWSNWYFSHGTFQCVPQIFTRLLDIQGGEFSKNNTPGNMLLDYNNNTSTNAKIAHSIMQIKGGNLGYYMDIMVKL